MDLAMVLAVLAVGGFLGLGLVAIWLRNGMDTNATREAVAQMIGDALAAAVAYAKTQIESVTDAQLDMLSVRVYDYWLPRLPERLRGLVAAYVTREQFQALFRSIWRKYLARARAMTP